MHNYDEKKAALLKRMNGIGLSWRDAALVRDFIQAADARIARQAEWYQRRCDQLLQLLKDEAPAVIVDRACHIMANGTDQLKETI